MIPTILLTLAACYAVTAIAWVVSDIVYHVGCRAIGMDPFEADDAE